MTLEEPGNRQSLDDPARGLSAVGDFDGDGHVDEAFFIKKEAKFFLVVCLDEGTRPVTLFELKHRPNRDIDGDDSVWALSPGIYVSSCAKAYGCTPRDHGELELAHEGILLSYERGLRIFYWADGRFNVLWIGS